MKKIIIIILLALFIPLHVSARSSGVRSSGGFRSSGIKSTPKVSVPRSPSTGVKSSLFGSSKPKTTTQKTPSTSTKKVYSTTPKTVSGKQYSKTGNVVDDNYKPSFRGGYVAPVGSTVYYRDNSMLDWLPFYFLMTHDSHREAVVVKPDGKEEIVKEEGIDGMYIFNWVIVILLGLGLIAGIIYLINKYTKKKHYYA